MDNMEADVPTGSHVALDQPFRSKLQDGPQRFLAYAIEHGLKHGRRSARDFVRHFPPAIIMEGLEDEPQLRANILVASTGLRMKVALKKSAASCGSDLQIALDERETDAETVVKLFEPDDRVRFLDNRALWSFVTEGDFWLVEAKKDAKGHALAATHISSLIERALEDQLLTHRDVVRGITVASMTELLPRSELPKIIEAALELGQANKPFVEKNLLAAIGITKLAEHIPLATLWTQVVVPYIAEAHGLVKAREDAVDHAKQDQARPRVSVEPGPVATPAKPSFVPAARAASAAPIAVKAPVAGEGSGLDLEVDELLTSLTGGKAAAKKAARRPGSIPPTA